MTGRRIADLHAALTWDLDDFERGTGQIKNGFGRLKDQAVKLGNDFMTLGKRMTTFITLPVAGMAAGFGVAAKGMANEARGMAASAKVAGEGFEQFQRQAYAASQVAGMEFTKLGDIFKDTKDKIGDFTASGQGEMADFFENIAPKVGVTAEMFRELSGKDGLQLYYDSLKKAGVGSNEMTFYMEAIASDAMMLTPLLEENGRLFDEWGAKANVTTPEQAASLERYRAATESLSLALSRVLFAIVDSGLLDSLTWLAEKVAGFVEWIAKTNPALIRFAGYAALVVAALGPIIAVLTTLAVTVLPLFLVGMGPIFLILSAIINPIGTLVIFLGKLIGGFSGIVGGLGGVLPILGRLAMLLLRLNPIAAAVITIFTLFGDKIWAALQKVWAMAQKTLGPAFARLFKVVGEVVDDLKAAWNDFANSAFGQFVAQIIAHIGDLIAAFVYIQGSGIVVAIGFLIDLITTVIEWTANMVAIVGKLLRGDFTGAWETAKDAVSNAINNMFPAFQSLWGWIHDTLALLGLVESRVSAATAPKNVSGAIGMGVEAMQKGMAAARQAGGRTPYTLPGKAATRKSGGGGGGGGRSGPTAAELADMREQLRLEHEIAVARESGDREALARLERQRDLKSKIEAYERAGLNIAAAKAAAEKDMLELDRARAETQAKALDQHERDFDIQLAQLRGDYEHLDQLEDQKFIQERIAELVGLEVSQKEAAVRASDDLLALEEARAEQAEKRLISEENARQIELARLRGDGDGAERLREDQRQRDRYDELRGGGKSEEEAHAIALQEGVDRSRAHLQGTFRDTFRGGLRAAMNGDLKGFFSKWLEDASFDALAKVLDRLADNLANLIFGQQGGGSGGGGGGGLLSGLGEVFGNLFGGSSGGSSGKAAAKAASLPGFVTGGSFKIKGFAGIDQNVLSLNGNPVARVGAGEIMNIRKSDAGGSGPLKFIIQDMGGMLDARIEDGAGRVLATAAPEMTRASTNLAVSKVMKMQSRRLA